MAKQLVTVINSSGKEYPARLSWAERKRDAGECFLQPDGKYRFPLRPQDNGGASTEVPQGVGGRMSFRIVLRPNEPTPGVGASLVTYPYPSATVTGSRALRALYPTLARAGAGL